MREKGRAWAGVRSSSGGGKLSDRRSSLRTLPFCTTCPRRLLPLSDISFPCPSLQHASSKMPPRGSEGYDFTPILTHYLFLFTTILAVVSPTRQLCYNTALDPSISKRRLDGL